MSTEVKMQIESFVRNLYHYANNLKSEEERLSGINMEICNVFADFTDVLVANSEVFDLRNWQLSCKAILEASKSNDPGKMLGIIEAVFGFFQLSPVV